ncbi:MAG TPA: porin [Stellaceae bacterium]|jgi:predicted porin|nr:porin [Stellaceae bacterium]
MTSPIRLGLRLALVLACAVLAAPSPARADALSDMKAQMQIMQQQMQALQKQLQDMSQKMQQQQQTTEKVQAQQQQEQEQLKAATPEKGHAFLEHKPGTATFYTPGGEITAYGNLDVSIDATTKGIQNKTVPGSSPPEHPTGRNGWLMAESTNLSYLGLRGFQNLGDFPANFVWQVETQIDIASSSGTAETNSNQSNVVKGGLTSRNSFIGLSSETYGALMIGKSDAPYKNATQRMNPFSGELGDYSVVMGNSGGDNRVEFGTRLDHSIWYESPKFAGFTANVLYSPGQNRSSSSDNIAAGESDCTGGNIPGSGGTGGAGIGPVRCNDGSFSDAISADVVYSEGPLYAVAAYERHMKVNRSSDILGSPLAALDTADEDAWKVGVQYAFPTRTTVSAIFEDMHRYVPGSLAFQNERQRKGTWLAVSQQITDSLSVHAGWAHAFKTPGDPGQHNTTAKANADNSANMFTAAVKYLITKNISVYADWAMTVNGPFAHYDLGAGGRAVTTDCHDASDGPTGSSSGGESSNPHCWAGGRLMGVSAGMKYQF